MQSLGTRVVEVKTVVPLYSACLQEAFYELGSSKSCNAGTLVMVRVSH